MFRMFSRCRTPPTTRMPSFPRVRTSRSLVPGDKTCLCSTWPGEAGRFSLRCWQTGDSFTIRRYFRLEPGKRRPLDFSVETKFGQFFRIKSTPGLDLESVGRDRCRSWTLVSLYERGYRKSITADINKARISSLRIFRL